MTKSRLSLRNTARHVLKLIFAAFLIGGCSTSTAPTYRKATLEKTFQKILRTEYKTEGRARLVGSTLWVYIAVEDLFERSEKPQKVKEQFEIQENTTSLSDGVLSVNYLVKRVPEREKLQEIGFNKKTMEKVNDAWELLRRMVFSMDRDERDQIRFYALVAADIKNGVEIMETVYYRDMFKALYHFISPNEYQHRLLFDTAMSSSIIKDRLGLHVDYRDVSLPEFICEQIQARIDLKFKKPEVDPDADVDKEVFKIVDETLKIYEFDNFRSAEFYNLYSNSRRVFPQESFRRASKAGFI